MINQALPDYTGELKEMAKSLQELKSLVSCGWTYGVIWKIGLDHRTPVWYQGYFNERGALAAGPAQQFEFIYRQCQFTPARPGYAYLAWQQQSPLWWTIDMDPVLTDKTKELFLAEAGIQTITCFPGRAIPDGTPYCVELACTALVSETEFLRTSIQEFLNTSIDPYISSYGQLMQEGAVGLDMESVGGPSAMVRALDHQTSAILTDITSQASMGEDEVIDGFGSTMLRREEPYSPWTAYGANLQSFDNNPTYATHFNHDHSFNYGSLLLPEPFSNPLIHSHDQWTVPYGSKGKEILVDQSELVLDESSNLSLLQQELLDKLKSPRAAASSSPRPVVVPTGGFRNNMRMPPGHSATSLFQRPRHVQKRTTSTKKSTRLPLIVKWATKLANRTVRIRDEGPGGSGFDDSPGTDTFEYRSPNGLAHDQQAAVAHKHAERIRRMKFSHKLQTLISIVPMTNKKKDKVSVLTSTIEYIRQLNSQISTLKKVEEGVGALTSRIEEGTLTTTANVDMDRESEELTEAGAGPSTSAAASPVVVVEESASPAGEDSKWVIKVEAANCHSRSLILLLNVLLELELETVTVNYGRTHGRFHANISVKSSRNASTSTEELQGKLCRVLETSADS